MLKLPYDDWWQAIVTGRVEGVDGLFVHPVEDEAVMAGNGTIGLEILEDLPDLDAVVIPYGGGGLTVGIASALRALRPQTRIYTVEPETGAALVAALAAGGPVEIDYSAVVRRRLGQPAGARRDVAARRAAGRRRARRSARATPPRRCACSPSALRVIAEGAGALATAAALAGRAGTGKVVCIVSGGNIDLATLAGILKGGDS